MTSRRLERQHAARNTLLALMLWICTQVAFREKYVAAAGRSATRSGVVGTATKVDGSHFNNKADSAYSTLSGYSGDGLVGNSSGRTPTERLRSFLLRTYDKSMPPVKDHRQSIKVQVDMTYRQVLDLDEKNQILKSLIWYRQYWTDEHFVWDPEQYDGIKELNIPSTSIWRPDIAVYEEVGTRDFNPRLPFVKINRHGEVRYAEPVVIETSCEVDTAFFPFDHQLCSMTFVSWSSPVTRIDLSARRDGESITKETMLYFINSGEWVLTEFEVSKQISLYLSQDEEENEILDYEAYQLQVKIPPTEVATTEHMGGRNLSGAMYAEVRYSVIIRRNSSLYMQSMLFPSILLTTVALLGFYLPPDSGERIGLQITILLTFMVFLLTVGEMFPASTGPYLGIYFVLSMAQLGVNIFMTVIVLHLHFKPCVQKKVTLNEFASDSLSSAGTPTEPESVIPVNLRRLLQFCNRYLSIADKEALWMLPISKKPEKIRKTPDIVRKNSARFECTPILDCEKASNGVGDDENHKIIPEQEPAANHVSQKERNESYTAECDFIDDASSTSDPSVSPLKVITVGPRNRAKSLQEKTASPASNRTQTSDKKKDRKKKAVNEANSPTPTPSPTKSQISETKKGLKALIASFQIDVKDIIQNEVHEKEINLDNTDLEEKKREADQEEWKSVARAVDRLFFRLYLFLMFLSHVTLLGIALKSHFTTEWKM